MYSTSKQITADLLTSEDLQECQVALEIIPHIRDRVGWVELERWGIVSCGENSIGVV